MERRKLELLNYHKKNRVLVNLCFELVSFHKCYPCCFEFVLSDKIRGDIECRIF